MRREGISLPLHRCGGTHWVCTGNSGCLCQQLRRCGRTTHMAGSTHTLHTCWGKRILYNDLGCMNEQKVNAHLRIARELPYYYQELMRAELYTYVLCSLSFIVYIGFSLSLSQDEGGEPIDCSTGTSGKRVNVFLGAEV